MVELKGGIYLMFNFSQQWLCLSGEASIASNTLKIGLEYLTNACKKYDYYPLAFFNLSIGLERLFKLILVCESIIEHNVNNLNLKKEFGHDLIKLKSKVDTIFKKYQIADDLNIISANMLIELSNFAKSERYFNLNYLLNNPDSICPVKSWSENVGNKLIENHCLEIANVPHYIPKVVPFGYTEQNIEMKTEKEYTANYILQLLKYKYTSYYMHGLIKHYANYFNLIWLSVHEQQLDIPYIYEFFEYFYRDSDHFINEHKTFPQ